MMNTSMFDYSIIICDFRHRDLFITEEEISVYNKSIHLSTTKKTHFFENSKVCIFRITFRTSIIINADVILL